MFTWLRIDCFYLFVLFLSFYFIVSYTRSRKCFNYTSHSSIRSGSQKTFNEQLWNSKLNIDLHSQAQTELFVKDILEINSAVEWGFELHLPQFEILLHCIRELPPLNPSTTECGRKITLKFVLLLLSQSYCCPDTFPFCQFQDSSVLFAI